MAYELAKVINHHFPDLRQQFSKVMEIRRAPQYKIEEIIGGAVAMFLFKTGSRNAMNGLANSREFKRNFNKLFNCRLPQMDTITKVFEKLPEQELEALKTKLVKRLIDKRIFDKHRLQGKLLVAVDGTGLYSYSYKHCDQCLEKTYKPNAKRTKEKKVYYHHILEAKLVTPNGFSISLCSEWIENDGQQYNKQDCERNAFARLARKLKAKFPRTGICILADGLYPNFRFFQICEENQWDYIVTLKDKSLKSFWEKIRLVNRELASGNFYRGSKWVQQKCQIIKQTSHNGFTHNWLQMDEMVMDKKHNKQNFRFVHLTNVDVNGDNARDISNIGRLRWKIEKQGFDQQKHHGYNITHKYCRKSYRGMKNFYQACQIAHMLNQLVELSKGFSEFLTGKTTISYLWSYLRAMMMVEEIQRTHLARVQAFCQQIEYFKEKIYLS